MSLVQVPPAVKFVAVASLSAIAMYASSTHRTKKIDDVYEKNRFIDEIDTGSSTMHNAFRKLRGRSNEQSDQTSGTKITRNISTSLRSVSVHISVKTTLRGHDPSDNSRIEGILSSWFDTDVNDTWFVGDNRSEFLSTLTMGHYRTSDCPNGHGIYDLCCKTEEEILWFLQRRRERNDLHWYCHVDDDMYVFKDNLKAMLSQYDVTQPWFIGPSTMWPEYKVPTLPRWHKRLTQRGIHVDESRAIHPIGAYCMSASLVETLAPYVRNRAFANSCSPLPDDIHISRVILEVTNTTLTINNNFHHQFSRHYKLPWYNLDMIRDNAITLHDYGNMSHVHSILQNGYGKEPWWKAVSSQLRRQVTARARRWHSDKPVHKQAAVSFNFCRQVVSPHRDIDARHSGNANWCGPPITTLPHVPEPLCFEMDRSPLKGWANPGGCIHPTHHHTDTTQAHCPYNVSAVPQVFGSVAGSGALPLLASARLWRRNVSYQNSAEGAFEIWGNLSTELASVEQLGTCCIANPEVPVSQGGACYWTAADQNACRDTRRHHDVERRPSRSHPTA
eukprot:m.588078 g.588078  ORF g.588078 m.588078 type:complete len:559 (-) comp22360_c0_seq12:622-2298(-)